MKNINDFIKENIDEVMKQEMDAAEEQYNKKMSHSSELEESYKSNLTKQYENDRKSIEEQMKELQDKLKKLDEQKDQLYQPLEEKLDDYQKRKEKRENSYQEEYKELLTKANDDANQKEFLLRQRNEEFEKFKDTTKMILKDWGIELVETNTDTKTKFSIVTPDTREIGFSFDYNNPEKPFFFIQDGNDKAEPVREECSAIEAAYILKEVALETSRQLKWFKNKDNKFSLNLTRVTENAFKDARDVNYEFDIPRLGKQQEELLEYYNDYFRTQRGDIEQTAEVLSQLEEVNDALTKDEQTTKKKIQEDNERLEELKRQQEKAQTEEEKELIRKEIEELTNNQKERHSFLENLKETKDDFKDKISTFWIHTVNGVQANIAKAQLTIREVQENIKNWFEQGDAKSFAKKTIAGVSAVLLLSALTPKSPKSPRESPSYGYTMECDDGRTVTGRTEMEAKAMCAYKNEEKSTVRTSLGEGEKLGHIDVSAEKTELATPSIEKMAKQDSLKNNHEVSPDSLGYVDVKGDTIEEKVNDYENKKEQGEDRIVIKDINEQEEEKIMDKKEELDKKQEEVKENGNQEETNKKEEAPSLTVTENKENNSYEISGTITTTKDDGKEEKVEITYSPEIKNTTFEQASEKLEEIKSEYEQAKQEEEERVKEDLKQLEEKEYSPEYQF